MNAAIKGNLKDYINKKVESGLYEDAGDFIRDAIRKFDKSSCGDYQTRSDTRVSDTNRSVLGDLIGGDIEALAFIVLQQAAKSVQEDLKAIMAHVKAINNAKAANRAIMEKISMDIAANEGHIDDLDKLRAIYEDIKNQFDSLNEMGEMESLRLQMTMDRMSKMTSTLSNILKKISDNTASITQNMK